ncbi:hypothetical protein NGRA_0231 [Nosema granulosis]|uniref:Uncharacterized protein n=1 Tax=Nosema granulosis TaxID=83296 RepID=A0A9P6L0R8_9MICR|nr:hypothetical protein NGRA_0231 [Nosema granulosis]
MQRFLEENPEYHETFELLKSIDQQAEDSKESHHYIEREDLKLYKYIYKTRLFMKKEIYDYLHALLEDIVSQERNNIVSLENSCNLIEDNHIERLRNKLYTSKVEMPVEIDTTEIKILRMFLGRDIYFSDFREKLFFLKHFKGFKKHFKGSGEKEFVLQDIFYKSKSTNKVDDKMIEEINSIIPELKDDKGLIYMPFLGTYLKESTKETLFDRVSIGYKAIVLRALEEESAYKKIAQVLLYESPKNKILFLNTVEIEDKLRVYYKISQETIRRSLDLKKMFLETLDILKILPINKRHSLLVLVGWSKTFIYYKNIEEGIKLYKNIMKVVGKEEAIDWIISFKNKEKQIEHDVMGDMVILSEFYSAIVEYKETGYLNFEKFVNKAQKIEDRNIFSPFKWKEIALMY